MFGLRYYYGALAEIVGDDIVKNDTWRIRIRKTARSKRCKVINEYVDIVCNENNIVTDRGELKSEVARYLLDVYFDHKKWD